MPVDALTPTFINSPDTVSGPAYDAETLRRDFGGLVAAGASAAAARSGVLDPRALVPSLSGQNVQVGPGPCVAGTGKGAYFSGAATVLTVDTLTPADSTNPRRDRLVFEVLDPDNGGSTARKARFRLITGQPSPTALTGGGYPADPGAADGVSTFFNIADIDMPKNGTGNPTITDRRPFTAAAGAPVKVRNQAERDTFPKWDGLAVERMDKGGLIERCYGGAWIGAADSVLMLPPDSGWTVSGGFIKTRTTGGLTLVQCVARVTRTATGKDFSINGSFGSLLVGVVPDGWRPVVPVDSFCTLNDGSAVGKAEPVVRVGTDGTMAFRIPGGATIAADTGWYFTLTSSWWQ
ncbi:hypothetical protein ABC337_05055 [Arthrobacter sp. 1P04PC]|uniref:hypothetical protein n=1 Tax=unclassified Arthrobacter TaxID=235627 RepID=UPI0039A2DE9B